MLRECSSASAEHIQNSAGTSNEHGTENTSTTDTNKITKEIPGAAISLVKSQENIVGCNLQAKSSNTSNVSTESIVCRICQLSENEVDEKLEESGCGCRGTIRLVHYSCLLKWVKFKRSGRCELCDQIYRDIRKIRLDILSQLENSAASQESEERAATPCCDSRRVWFLVMTISLILSTGVAGALTYYTHREYQVAWQAHYAPKSTREAEVHPTSSIEEIRFCYSLSVAVMTFCATLALGIIIIWSVAECYVWPAERELENEWELFAMTEEEMEWAGGLEASTEALVETGNGDIPDVVQHV